MFKRVQTLPLLALAIAVILGAARWRAVIAAGDSPGAHSQATPSLPPTTASGFETWVDVEIIQELVHHTVSVVVAVVTFWLVGFLVQRMLHNSLIKRCVLILDEFILLCLFVFFAYELFQYLLATRI